MPPADLASRTPEFVTLTLGAIVERFYTAAYDPIYFDRSTLGRFNAPDGSYGVLYAAEQLAGAFAETFLRMPGRTLLPPDLVRQKARARIRITRQLRLIKLAGSGLARLGATAEVVHGGLPYHVPQAWSKALKEHPTQPDGVAYRARHDDDAICYALFNHAPMPVQEYSRDTDLDGHDWFWREAARYDIGLAPS
jgi:hypothetical protein